MLKVNVPEGKSGKWSIEKFHITERDAGLHFLRCLINGYPERAVVSGDFTRLVFDNSEIVMSDTPAEINDHLPFISQAHGHVLIAGLGLGFVAEQCALRPEVDSVTVIEIEKDVIALVKDHLAKYDKITIIEGDALDWVADIDGYYNCVWLDIWPSINPDNLKEILGLEDWFDQFVVEGGLVDSWSKKEILRMGR